MKILASTAVDWLLVNGESNQNVRAELARTLVEDAFVSTTTLVWTQMTWAIVYHLTGWSWLFLLSAIDIAIFCGKRRLVRLVDGKSHVDDRSILTIFLTHFCWTLLIAVQIVILFTLPSPRAAAMALILSAGFNGYACILYASFPRVALFLSLWIDIALTAGLSIASAWELHILAPLGVLLLVSFALVLRSAKNRILEIVRSRQIHFEQARRDPLTGLANRIVMMELLTEYCSASKPPKDRDRTFGVLCMDLDGFKAVNDRHGHAAGDRVLVEVANRLLAEVRRADTVIRLGGDEYVALVPNVDRTTADRIAGRIVASVAEPIAVGSTTFVKFGISVGIACKEGQAITPEELLQQADEHLYDVKRSRRNRYQAAS